MYTMSGTWPPTYSNIASQLTSYSTVRQLPNVDPTSGERDKAVPFKVLMKFRTGVIPEDKWKPCVGCNAVPAASGVVSVGDEVRVRKLIAGQ